MSQVGAKKDTVDLKRYIPFLQRMISSFAEENDEGKLTQKEKFESLLNVISSSDTRLKPETHARCEEVLRKLYGKFGKDCDLGAKSGSPKKPQVDNGRWPVYSNREFGRDEDIPKGSPFEGSLYPIPRPGYDFKTAANRPSDFRDGVRNISYQDTHGMGQQSERQQSTFTHASLKGSHDSCSDHAFGTFCEDACWKNDIRSFHVPTHFEFEHASDMECRVGSVVRKAAGLSPVLSSSSVTSWEGRSPSTVAHLPERKGGQDTWNYRRQGEWRTRNPHSVSEVDGPHTSTGNHISSRSIKQERIAARYEPYPLTDYKHGSRLFSGKEADQGFRRTESFAEFHSRRNEPASLLTLQFENFGPNSLDRRVDGSQGSSYLPVPNHSSRVYSEATLTNPSAVKDQRFANAVSIRPFSINQKPTLEHPETYQATFDTPYHGRLSNRLSAVVSKGNRRLDPRLRKKKSATRANVEAQSNPTGKTSDVANIRPETSKLITSPVPDATSDSFRSPLKSLYSGPVTQQKGLGYGPQNITKKSVISEVKNREVGNAPSNSVGSDSCKTTIEDPVVVENLNVEKPTIAKSGVPVSKEVESSSKQPDPVVPLNVIESYLKKVLPLEEAQKVVDRVRCLEELKTEGTRTSVIKPGKSCNTDGRQDCGEETPNPFNSDVASEGPLGVSSHGKTSESSSALATIHEEIRGGELLAEGLTPPLFCEPPETTCQKSGKSSAKKNSVSFFEVKRLHEESLKFLGGLSLLDGQRPRRSASKKDGFVDEVSDALKGKLQQHKRKTKALVSNAKQITVGSSSKRPALGSFGESSEVSSVKTVGTEDCPVVKIHVSDDYFSSEERGRVNIGSSFIHSHSQHILVASSAQTPDVAYNVVDQAQTTRSASCEQRSKAAHSTRSSLPEEMSMHDVPVLSVNLEALDAMEIPAECAKHFRCADCTFTGHEIVKHYVNEHPGVHIPYAVMPKETWDVLKDLPLGPPTRYEHTKDLRDGCDWIPTGPTYYVPLACKLCSFTASLRSELLEHFLLHGFDRSFKYRCLLCATEEDNYFEMYDHLTMHTGEYRHRCGHCNHREARKSELKRHMEKHHSMQDQLFFSTDTVNCVDFWAYAFVCCDCRYWQLSEDNLITHVSSHSKCQSYSQVNAIEAVFLSEEPATHSPRAPDALDSSHASTSACIIERYFEVKALCTERRSWQPQFGVGLLKKLESSESEKEPGPSLRSCNERHRKHGSEVLWTVPFCELEIPDVESAVLGANFQKLLEETVHNLRGRVRSGHSVLSESEVAREDNLWGSPVLAFQDLNEEGDMFLKVANVVSLRPLPEKDQWIEVLETMEQTQPVVEEEDGGCEVLRTVWTDVTFNMVALLKEECTFPFRIPHNRIKFAEEKKEPQAYSLMMMAENITNLFKCMAFDCSFSSSCRLTFHSHVNEHEEYYCQVAVRRPTAGNADCDVVSVPDFYLCSYCPFVGQSNENLLLHVGTTHGVQQSYQCSTCFFRGASALHVEYHVLRDHSCKRGISVLPSANHCDVESGSSTVLKPSDLPRYFCTSGHCNLSFVTHEAFHRHIKSIHPGTECFTCSYCGHSAPPNELFKHSVVHGLGAFQCLYCAFGTNSLEGVLDHVTLVHADQAVKVYWRSERCTRPVLRLSQRSNQGRPAQEVLSRVFAMAEFVVINAKAAQFEHLSGADALVCKEACFDDSRANKATRSDAPSAASSSSPIPSSGVSFTLLSSGGDRAGLAGHDLYICGNIGCHFSAPDAAELKEHLCVCDLARDSEMLTCYHCLKPQKSVSQLMDHLKTHGLKPYACGLCGKCFESFSRATWHAKKAHHSPGSCVSLASSRTPGSRFTVCPRAALKSLAGLESLESLATEKKSFRSEELSKVPSKEVFTVDIHCGECNFSSKVRSNLIKHLKLHQAGIVEPELVPHTSPINPAVYPRRGTKLFDKAKNLSTDDQETFLSIPGKQSDLQGSSSMISFIPSSKRFICGLAGCLYIGNNEDDIMFHVVNHKGELFDCPHCPSERKTFNQAEFLHHLKLHGPSLYGCSNCPFVHWRRAAIKQHMDGAHPGHNHREVVFREFRNGVEASTGSTQLGERWKCTLCRHVTDTLNEISAHVQNQHGVRDQFCCVLCLERFSNKDAVVKHYSSIHPAGTTEILVLFHRCLPSKRPSSDSLNEHAPLWKRRDDGFRLIRGIALAGEMEDALQKKFVQGSICDVEVPSSPDTAATATPVVSVDPPIAQSARKKVQTHGPSGPPVGNMLYCPLCPEFRTSRKRSYSFRMHLYHELDYKRFKCSLCSKKYTSRSIAKHLKDQHKGQQPQVIQLPRDLNIESWVENVVKSQLEMVKQSSKADQTKTSEGKSLATGPSRPVREEPATRPTFVTFSCCVCDLVFALEAEVIAHHTSHPDQQLTYRTNFLFSSDIQMEYETSVEYACPLCRDCFSTRHSVKDHLKQHPNAVQCGACYRLSATPEDVALHWQKQHGSEKNCVFVPIVAKLLDYVSVRTVRVPLAKSSDSCTGGIQEGRSRPTTELNNETAIVTGEAGRSSCESQVNDPDVSGKSRTKDRRQSANKVTGSPADFIEKLSFYGKKPATEDLTNIFTLIDCNDSGSQKVSLAALAKKMSLFPVVKLKDCVAMSNQYV